MVDRLSIIGEYCPHCAREHGRMDDVIDPKIHNHECRSCGGDLPVEPYEP